MSSKTYETTKQRTLTDISGFRQEAEPGLYNAPTTEDDDWWPGK